MELTKKTSTQIPSCGSSYYKVNILFALILSACGGKSKDSAEVPIKIGFSSSYKPPLASTDIITGVDENFQVLLPEYTSPYWVSSLQMSDGTQIISSILEGSENIINFGFPEVMPDYYIPETKEWAPASELVKNASLEIFSKLNETLATNFEIGSDLTQFNYVSIGLSEQKNTAGISYYPNILYEVGSDIFISKDYANPEFISELNTNYDYEVLVHEIGHALGLKHPFDGDLESYTILSDYEDHSAHTVMSYDINDTTFTGTFRNLDWMTLTKLYGINKEYKATDDTYYFSDHSSTFIIDGGGIDRIDASQSVYNIYVDLRPGTHSFAHEKSNFITASKQLTISHNSMIENVLTGLGSDYVVGNSLDNHIETSAGDDKIFLGDGADYVNSGAGNDIIDLSESKQFVDTVEFEKNDRIDGTDTIYGFVQGALGDILDFSSYFYSSLIVLPLVNVDHVPSGYISGALARVFGVNLFSASDILDGFADGGSLSALSLSNNTSALIICADSQKTGEEQRLFELRLENDIYEAVQLSTFYGNYLDIDTWSAHNFLT